jgi:type III pantothenate kinase
MLLALDVGNTNTVIGVFKGEELVSHWRLRTIQGQTPDEMGILILSLLRLAEIESSGIKALVVSCVVPPVLRTIEQFCRRYFNRDPLVVGPGMEIGMPVLIDNPKEVGADRLVNAVAAYEHYRQSCIVVDFGTATTFDMVSKRGEYLGGVIATGVVSSSEALFMKASKLPKVDFAKPPSVIGKDTVSAMQAGLFWGYVSLVDGIVKKMVAEYGMGDVRVIATGGLASVIAPDSATIEEVDEFLTLKGLKIIYKRNIPPFSAY